jgi:hypothetical protein
VMWMLRLGVPFPFFLDVFIVLPPIRRIWLLLSVSARAGNGGILLVVVRAIPLLSVVGQIQALLTTQRAIIS